ncbi:acetoacetate--CoA ligase [Caballeronia sp. LZ062]|uniref:acetoacetate--CoA ligase n=1 Tax=unclassified Caballeronia TaxID=2646786 RepID=UPI0028558C54|nr:MULTISPECIES: acetoacetate--CoA ligase [unclassified Caballeronia]MDR5857035.1 acetoacetate--CoA ligase [Caballeronia sp. LZ050]MDR5869568.1 acetoacetate--CoA ligase [Caballeronia sp. LZ062]
MQGHHAIRGRASTGSRPPLFQPDAERVSRSRMTRFTAEFEKATGEHFADYLSLQSYCAREFRRFWQYFLLSAEGLEWSGDADVVCVGDRCETAHFFPHVELNYAENLLNAGIAPDDAPALTSCFADGGRVAYTRGELRERVMQLAQALHELGLRPGDRVVAIMRNDADAITTALAVTALGATLSTAAPENGVQSIVDRFAPLAPRMLFAHTTQRSFDTAGALSAHVAAVAAELPSLTDIVCLDETPLPTGIGTRQHRVSELIGRGDPARFTWQRFPFSHPLFIMFSSGTTGKPKCIVHGAGGTLIEHVKEHRLHSDLGPGDKLFFFTSCSWMMWNWQLSALASGVQIVTYDGPVAAVDTLWRIAANERVTVFGTSPAYLKMSEDAGLQPAAQFDLSSLRAMMSTGAVLFDSQFHWVDRHVKPLQLQSISGGTDILGCFVLGNPNLPVYAGEAQCKSLGLDVQAFDHGAPTAMPGELVCTNPFPSRPLGFFGDDAGARFHAAYFSQNEGVWTHGDVIEFAPEGSARLHGRSDGVLNVRGINVSPGEIYRILSDIPEICQAMAVAQTGERAGESGQRIVLLLVLRPGVRLNAALAVRVRREIMRQGSAALVPDVIVQVDGLPVTHNGKPSEAAARDAVNGLPARNVASLANPGCLDGIREHPMLARQTRELPAPDESVESVEAYLCALWEQYFNFAPIGRDDNFFELGGHSLLAARMLADIRRTTRRTLPIATLIVAPTIARLTAAIVSDQSDSVANSTLVQMRAGRGRPLFMVHSITGSVMECLTLAGTLQSERPVYGLQAQGLDGDEPPQRSVEDMARAYVLRMRGVQPTGPYALVGYSFGGLVAFEIAQQLVAAGEKIEMLCLLDTYVHERCLPLSAWARYQAAMLAYRIREFRSLDRRERMGYVRGKAFALTDRFRMRLGKTAQRPGPETRGLPPPMRLVRESMRVAMTTYKPRRYLGGPIVYVRASIMQDDRGDPLPVWQRVAKQGLRIMQVEGRHNDLVVEPHLATIALALAQLLSNI